MAFGMALSFTGLSDGRAGFQRRSRRAVRWSEWSWFLYGSKPAPEGAGEHCECRDESFVAGLPGRPGELPAPDIERPVGKPVSGPESAARRDAMLESELGGGDDQGGVDREHGSDSEGVAESGRKAPVGVTGAGAGQPFG